MAKLALVNPQLVSSRWKAGSRPQTMDDALPRHGLTFLSAALKRAGHEVVLADLRLLSGWGEYEALIKRQRPDFVCVTGHTQEVQAALECLKRAKKILPECITVAGGIHFSMYPALAIDAGCTDYVIRGEGEISLVKLAENPNALPQVFWAETPDLDDIPFEDRELYPDYSCRIRFPLWDLPTPIVDILTKRGCPWRCRFCCGPGEQNLFSKPSGKNPEVRIPAFRHRSVSNVIAEMEELYGKYRFKGVVFSDDQFVIQKEWVKQFCEELHRTGFVRRGVRWWAGSRADIICRYPDVIRAMKDAGLHIISIGFESFNDSILEWLGKGVDSKTNFKAAEICHELGLDIFANVMFGIVNSHGEWNIEDDIASIQAINRMRPRYFSPSFFSPIPGSWFYEWAMGKGLLRDTSPERMGNRTPSEMKVRGVDYEKISELLKQCRKQFKSPLSDIYRYYLYRFQVWKNRYANCTINGL
jgi:anaerobic magnesium-protoporphyrin IX monomethyl ester cyclase